MTGKELPGISRKCKLAGVKKKKLKYDPDVNPKPRILTSIANGTVTDVNGGDYVSVLTTRRIVEFLVGCTADEVGEWMRVLTIHKPVLAVWVIELYSAKVAREKKRVSAFLRKNIPIAIMPNGIARSTAKPGSCFDP